MTLQLEREPGTVEAQPEKPAKRTKRANRSRIASFLIDMHTVTGVFAAGAIIVVCVTGILINHPQLFGLLREAAAPTTTHAPLEGALSVEEVVSTAQEAVAGPDGEAPELDRAEWKVADGIVEVRLETTPAATTVIVDDATGEVVDIIERPDLQVVDAHSGAILGDPWVALSDIVAVVLTLSVISGGLIWLRRIRKAQRLVGARDGSLWIRANWWVHLVGGLLAATYLIVLSVTGVLLNHKKQMGLMSESPDVPRPDSLVTALPIPAVIDAAVAHRGADFSVEDVKKVDFRPKGYAKVRFTDDAYEVIVNSETGVVEVEGRRWDVWIKDLHTGLTFGGEPGRLLADIPAALTILLTVNGIFLWARPAWTSRTQQARRSRRGMGLPSVGGGGAATRTPLRVLFGSQTGNAESVAEDLAATAVASGFDAKVSSLDDIDLAVLADLGYVLIVTSTYGEGEMPDNAELFWQALSAPDAPSLDGLAYGVLALGDSSYDGFCEAGRLIDARLEELGAERIVSRVECDIDYEAPATQWIANAVGTLVAATGASVQPVMPVGTSKSGWTRTNPFTADVVVKRRLSGAGSAKEMQHYEIDLADSGISYEAGDAIAIIPENDPALVDAIASHFGVAPDTHVDGVPLDELLRYRYELSVPSRELLAEVAGRAGNVELSAAVNGDADTLESWRHGKDVLDVLDIAGATIGLQDLVGLLKPLKHRSYSISSSPLAHPDRIHLTVATVRYGSAGRERTGVCSAYLADRTGTAKVFLAPNKAFRVPADDGVPIIMTGPGTGVAPFRAFLQEREQRAAKGENWLFFGDQHRDHDFSYADELEAWRASGLLDRLDLAFSRDQADKVYVQDRMRENGAELFRWLERGAHFYVCGDATRMAKDVDQALHEIVAEHGGLSAAGADAYVNDLKRQKRYVRDVY